MMRTRALLVSIVALLAALTLLVAGCEVEDEPAIADEVGLSMGAGSPGGTYFPLAVAMADTWRAIVDVDVATQSTAGSIQNLQFLGGGAIDVAIAFNDVGVAAYQGIGVFGGEPVALEAVGNVYPEVVQIVAPADGDLETVGDLAGARVSLGPEESTTELTARSLLDHAGLDADTDLDAVAMPFEEAAVALEAGELDAAFAVGPLESPAIEDLASSLDIRLLGVEPEVQESVIAERPSLSPHFVPPFTYTGQDEDAETLTYWATVYVVEGFDDDVAYELTRGIFEGESLIADIVPVGDEIDILNAAKGLGPIPLNDGSERYLDEQGALDDIEAPE